MTYAFLISAFDKKVEFEKITEKLQQLFQKSEIVFLCNNKEIQNQNCLVFNENTTEDMALNYAIKKVTAKKMFIIRNNYDLNDIEEIALLTKHDAEISMFKNKTNKFVQFFKNITNKISEKLFQIKMFDGDLSCVYYGEIVTEVLKSLDTPATFSKIDKWAGIRINYVEKTVKNPYKPKVDLTNYYIMLAVFPLLAAGMITLSCLVPFFQTFFMVLMTVFISLLSLIAILFVIWRIVFNNKIGKIENNMGEIIEIKIANNKPKKNSNSKKSKKE